MKFKLLENELEDRYKKHAKKQKGLSPFSYMGDPQKSIDTFNHSVAPGASAPTGNGAATAAPAGGMGEGLEKNHYIYSGPVYRFSKQFDTVKDVPTDAVSIAKAASNICFKLKQKYGFEKASNLSIDRSKIVQVSENKVDSAKKKHYNINVNEDDGTVEVIRDGVIEMTFPSIEAAEEVLNSLEVQ